MGGRKKRRRSNWRSRCGGCRPIASTCCNFTRSFAWKIPSASLPRAAEWKRLWKRKKRARCATSDSPGTKPRHPFEDVGYGGRAPISLRCGANAAERDGRALQQLREEGVAGAGEEGDRGVGDEADGRGNYSAQQDRGADGVSTLCDEPADE